MVNALQSEPLMTKKTRPEDLLDWIGLRNAPDWRSARWLGRWIGFIASTVLIFAPFLVLFALGSAFIVVLGTAHQIFTGAGGPNLGAGALIAAILGAPFVIWGTVIRHRQLGFQKDGHITDRISKAVEQLGAEKVVERIGRPVTIFTGKPERINYSEETAIKLADKPRTKLAQKEWDRSWNHDTDDVEEGYRQTVTTWPTERTVIQWQGEPVDLGKDEEVGSEGAWQVFKETAPNIEVRIGGLLSLERIAQDSVAYDKGRDHVRVMEILCAYIRNNAPVERQSENTDDASSPRSDIVIALNILGKRSPAGRQIEAATRTTTLWETQRDLSKKSTNAAGNLAKIAALFDGVSIYISTDLDFLESSFGDGSNTFEGAIPRDITGPDGWTRECLGWNIHEAYFNWLTCHSVSSDRGTHS